MFAITGVLRLLGTLLELLGACLRPRTALAAENLFLRRQLGLYTERNVKARRPDRVTRFALAYLSKFFNWREALTIVRPRTLIGWHRAGFRLLWRWKSKSGRPPISIELRELIKRMAQDNPLWGEERIANELLLKLGVRLSPRTVSKYMPKRAPGTPRGDQRWATFLRNHAKAIVACDFLVSVTATLRLLYVFVIIEHGSRKLLHFNVTRNPSAEWTLQQLRDALAFNEQYRYLLHDRDCIFARHLDESIARLGVRILKSPPRAPKANAICERLIGSIRRECLDWLIPLSESHLRAILREWAAHYNGGRPHMSLGPGIPDPPETTLARQQPRHHMSAESVRVRAILGGLHHEYALADA
jgi:putative transposase